MSEVTESRDAFLARSHTGIVTFKDGLGYFIQPSDDDRALVGFNDVDPNKLPDNFQVGDNIEFFLDKESQGTNASTWTKIEEKGEVG